MPASPLLAVEVAAIHRLRAKYATLPQMTLAKRIRARDFNTPEDRETALRTGSRPMLSTYSVIRRLDAAHKTAAPQAA